MMEHCETKLEDSYRHCVRVTRSRARNFYFGICLLPPQKRRALCAIYAFMRSCDDIADDAPVESRAAQLQDLRQSLTAALNGDCGDSPVLPAFHDAVQRYHIPGDYFHALIDGAEMDQQVKRYAAFEDLYQYCYRVASVVGLVCLYVFGFQDEEAKRFAEYRGVAFQLTNILRDVGEDAAADRIYLPLEDLDRFGVTEEQILRGERNEAFLALMAFEAERARRCYRESDALLPLISADSRGCLAAMSDIYEGLLDRLEQTQFHVFEGRTRLSKGAKLTRAARAWWRYRGGGDPPSHA